MSDIPTADKKAEIVPAIHSCEIIFEELN